MDASRDRWMLFEKMKMGFLMGGITGMSIGFLSGAFTVLRYGPGERGYLATVGQQMLQSGGFFAFLMSIGSLLRTEGDESPLAIEYGPARRFPQQQQQPRAWMAAAAAAPASSLAFALFPERRRVVVEELWRR
ncbi:reactive mitochondrial oxygen species modulator 1-domain-containing protein [Zopfochytrium polystomum]|nr:reactive mitochondrial oxygen species modulator 1-domain-containing protein [Zopfochytrium polystomum]